ncbi:hypothetical protein BH20VER1_BH20VER1_09460 [soil metagenome]
MRWHNSPEPTIMATEKKKTDAAKKPQVKVGDLAPAKDAKGGRRSSAGGPGRRGRPIRNLE